MKVFRQIGDRRLGDEQEATHTGRVLQRDPNMPDWRDWRERKTKLDGMAEMQLDR